MGLLFVAGLLVGLLLREVMIRVLLFALGGIFVAIREYLNTRYKTVTGGLIFIAFIAAIGIEPPCTFWAVAAVPVEAAKPQAWHRRS